MPYGYMFDVLVFAANLANCSFEPTWEPILGCFELDPSVLELVATFMILIRVSVRWP